MLFSFSEADADSTSKMDRIHSDESLCHFVETIVGLAQRKRLTVRPWSLAELELDEEDYLFLCGWGQSLPPEQVDRWLNLKRDMPSTKFTYRQGFGLLFLLLAVEHARREGKMGQIWPDVAPLFSDRYPTGNTRSLLFTPQPFPESSTLEAIHEALIVFRLRHDLENKGDAQYWMNSIFLQFGFTRTGIENGLSNWLLYPETRPVVIQSLLDTSDPRHSETFRDFWQVLLELRHHRLSEETAKARLLISGWILPNHLQAAMKAAKARIGKTAVPLNGMRDDATALTFLTDPCLRWKEADPQFYCRIAISASLIATLPDSVKMLQIYIGATPVDRLQRQSNGMFSTGSEIPLPNTRPYYEATLEGVSLGENGQETHEILALQTVSLWDSNAAVTIYDLITNEQKDAEIARLRPEQVYALIIPADEAVRPAPAALPIPVATYWHIVRLDTVWSRQMGVWLNEALLWQPVMTLQIRPSEPPEWIEGGTLNCLACDPQQVAFNEATQVSITCVRSAELVHARFLGHKRECRKIAPGQYQSEPIIFPPDISPSQRSLNLVLRNGEQTVSITRPIDIKMYGLAFRHGSEWRAHSPSAALNLDDVRNLRARVAVPIRDIPWKLCDGCNILGSAPFDSLLFPPCVGLGEALSLASPSQSNIVLAPQVVASGEITDVWFGERSRSLVVGLRSLTFAPSHNHKMIWWDFNGEIYFVNMQGGTEDGRMWWTVGYPSDATRPRALALAYGEKGQPKTWMGLWYADNWHEKLDFSSPDAVYRMSRRLRWFRLPVLSKEGRLVLRESAFSDREGALKAWRTRQSIKNLLGFSADRMEVEKFVLPILRS